MHSLKLLCAAAVAFLMSGSLSAQEDVPDSENAQQNLVQNIQALTKGNNAFATDLYFRLKDKPGNIIASPYTVSTAVSMAYAGALGATKGQMNAVMHYLPQGQNLYDAFSSLNRLLSKSWYQGPNENKIFLANSLWVQQELRILPDFLNIMNSYYKSDFKQVDFARNPGSARMQINQWVREKTQGRIEDLVGESDISTSTRLVLIASIFFKAVWENPFEVSLTKQAPFFVSANKTVSVPMMNTTATFPVFQGNDFTLIELPYRHSQGEGAELSFVVLLPKDRFGLSQFEKEFSADRLDRWLGSSRPEKVILSFPKFEMNSTFDLTTPLQQMGMTAAFSERADFSEITGDSSLQLTSVLHKAYLKLDEKGSEAVAATAVVIGLKSVLEPVKPLALEVNHPFMFLIVDKLTGSILFIGRLTLP